MALQQRLRSVKSNHTEDSTPEGSEKEEEKGQNSKMK
jgi:hypothetical protein